MFYLQLFKASLSSPKKLAAFRMLPIGKVMKYLFTLVTLISIVSFLTFTSSITSFGEMDVTFPNYMEEMKWILYPFAIILQFVVATLLLFTQISIVAYIGLLIGRVWKRRIEFRQIWRTAAIAYTAPFLVAFILNFFPTSDTVGTFVSFLLHLVVVLWSVSFYPKNVA
ncbi:DUF1189 family protein [Paenisporosarcina cavernae]|uniref:DUF1189 domain-containing protein n=1 Tax=Paenisporosarcina cavernae TaxID=2320858 RepID=A0A385YUI6_9BACL|nr:DUF1189 family protein [Paenisporosarcina cavernae]AYC29587.1 DUF1189 domain-containing protein [Paenisporosarcina cavernae]